MFALLVVYNLHDFFFLLIQGHNGQKKYQVNLRSHSAPIQVMLINRETSCSKPVVVPVPPVDDISAMPTPPSTPAGLLRFPISSTELCDLNAWAAQKPRCRAPNSHRPLRPPTCTWVLLLFILTPFLTVPI